MTEYEDVIRIKKQNDSFDDLRMEFAQMLRNQLAKGNNGLIRTKYITVWIEADNSPGRQNQNWNVSKQTYSIILRFSGYLHIR